MLGQLELNSIAILEVGPSESRRFVRRNWIAESIEERDEGEEEVMLIINGLDDVGLFWTIVWIQSR
jgi:hypothetical protein